MPDTWAKRAPLTGIVAVVLLIASFAIGSETPEFDASGPGAWKVWLAMAVAVVQSGRRCARSSARYRKA